MKINLRTLCLFLFVLAVAVTPLVQAQEEAEMAAETEAVEAIAEEAVEAESIDGKVAAVNLQEGYLVLEVEAADMAEESESGVFSFAPESLITQNGETLTTADVAAGQSVSIAYTSDAEGKNTILSLEIVM